MKCLNYSLCNKMMHTTSCLKGHCNKCFILLSFYKDNQLLFHSIKSAQSHCSNCFVSNICYFSPTCSHPLCKTCFLENYYYPISTEPIFPYNELTYYDNPTKFTNDPLISNYFNECNQWTLDNKKLDITHQSCIICNTNNAITLLLTGTAVFIYIYIPILFVISMSITVIYITSHVLLCLYD